jgi:hypothetical protein
VGSCEHGNEPSGSIKHKEFLDQMSNFHIVNDSDAWNWYEVKLVLKLIAIKK